MKLINRLRNKYTVVTITIVLIMIAGFLYGKKAVVEFKLIVGNAVSVSDFNLVHNNSCGNQFWDEGKVRNIYGYVEWVNVFSKDKYPNLSYQKFIILESRDNSSSRIEIFVGGDRDKEIFEKLLSIRNEQEEFSGQKINVSGVVAGGNMPVAGWGACSRGSYLIVTNPNQITY